MTISNQLYTHFCTPTDGGVLVDFTSKTLLNEDGTGVTLDEFIDTALTAERERLVSEIEKMEVYDDEPDNCRRIISEIKYLINNK